MPHPEVASGKPQGTSWKHHGCSVAVGEQFAQFGGTEFKPKVLLEGSCGQPTALELPGT